MAVQLRVTIFWKPKRSTTWLAPGGGVQHQGWGAHLKIALVTYLILQHTIKTKLFHITSSGVAWGMQGGPATPGATSGGAHSHSQLSAPAWLIHSLSYCSAGCAGWL